MFRAQPLLFLVALSFVLLLHHIRHSRRVNPYGWSKPWASFETREPPRDQPMFSRALPFPPPSPQGETEAKFPSFQFTSAGEGYGYTQATLGPLRYFNCFVTHSFQRLAAIRDQWRRIIAAKIEDKPELKQVTQEKLKTASDIKSENQLLFFVETENHMLTTENPQTAMNTKTEKLKFFGTRTVKPI